ncbi:MAG: hypothetical protein JO257_15755 [Deltaproteobacteria bacterium]|nr:hypothetical protein [Deltaproteobacteria bacterium]
MKLLLVVLLAAACDQTFGLQFVPLPDDGARGDGAVGDGAVDGPPGAWARLEPGAQHVCGLTNEGRLYCFGTGPAGGNTTTPTSPDPAMRTWTDLASAGETSCGISAGVAYCWGVQDSHQVDGGSTINIPTPTPVTLPETVMSIHAGRYHSCALTAAGRVYCWGNTQQILVTGGGPTLISIDKPLTALATGVDHTCGIDTSRVVRCWGADGQGQSSGTACTSPPCNATTPTTLAFSGPALSIAAGRELTCAIVNISGGTSDTTGSLYCWGKDMFGTDAPAPHLIGLQQYERVVIGNHVACGIVGSTASCFGQVSQGGFGDGMMNERIDTTAPLKMLPGDELSFARSWTSDDSERACAVGAAGGRCWGPPATPTTVPAPVQ